MIVGPKIMGNAITELFEGAYGQMTGVPEAAIDFNTIGKLLLLLGGLYVVSSVFTLSSTIHYREVLLEKQFMIYEKDVNQELEKLPLNIMTVAQQAVL